MAELQTAPLSPMLLDILRCPVCKGDLAQCADSLSCPACERVYPVVLGIPDLRVYEDPLIPLEDDYRKGEKIQHQAERAGFEDLVRFYWSLPTYPYTPPDMCERFINHVLTDEQRIEGYKSSIGRGQALLEVGCGTAALVKVCHDRFQFSVGCDVAFRWLLIARKRLQEAGQPVHLVCCCADYLPFPDGFFSSVASVSLLEHVSDAAKAIREFSRVCSREGTIFTWTTNRFSITREPHVNVWGVGFLPRRWMPPYVKLMSGFAYEKKRLLSRFEIGRCLRQAGFPAMRFVFPEISEVDWAKLSSPAKLGARIFLFAARFPGVRDVLIAIFPVLLVVAARNHRSLAEAAKEPGRAAALPA